MTKQRQIEFRVWDEVDKLFIDKGKGLTFIDLAEFDCGDEEFIFQQFTGLKDKKGKKIFEGDVLKSNINGSHFPVEYKEVFYSDGKFQYKYKSSRWSNTFVKDLCESTINQLQLEVVGNIFENPELLK